jgi:hypothetical protein
MKREKNANKEGGKAGPKKQRKKAAVKLPKVESDTEGICYSCIAQQFLCHVPVGCVFGL